MGIAAPSIRREAAASRRGLLGRETRRTDLGRIIWFDKGRFTNDLFQYLFATLIGKKTTMI